MNVHVLTVRHIGKETNQVEGQEEGVLLTDPLAVYSAAGEWEAIRPWLDRVSPLELADRSGVSPRMLRNLRQGNGRPSPEKLEALAEALVELLHEERPA